MTRILLIRHGHTEPLGRVLYGRTPGVHLSEQGTQETTRLASALRERYKIDDIVASPMDRTKETAEVIAAAQKQRVVFDDDLQEIDFGEWMGKSFSDLGDDEQWKQYNRNRSLNPAPGGEYMLEVQLRAWKALQRIMASRRIYPETTVAVVSHGDVVRALLMLFLGIPLDNIHRLEVWPASVSEVILGQAYPQVITMNQTF
ncbi:MAG: histidine phosphatase family protein [Acidobacteriaceae bacterium]|nr:histidine phosphatase family protein [Acidobacteriaceae bacterium]